MKKLITLLILFVGMVSSASATDYYLVGDIAGGWTPTPVASSKALKMTQSSNITGIYFYDYTSPSSSNTHFAIADGDGTGEGSDAQWSDFNSNHRWANSTNNYELNGDEYDVATGHYGNSIKLTYDGGTTYRIVFDSNTSKLSCVKIVDYVVAGCYKNDETASFFGTAWDNDNSDNLMTIQDNGAYAKSYSNVPFDETGTITYKIFEKGTWTGTSTNQTKSVDTKYTYDIKFEFRNNINSPTCTVTESAVSNYYIVGGLGTDPWTVSATPMSAESGIHTVSFNQPSASNYYRFAVAPNTVIKDGSIFNWNRIVRPACGKKSDWTLYFQNISDYWTTTDDTQGDAWNIPTSLGDCSWTFSFNSNTNKWSVAPYFTRNISAGYATFSSTYDVAVAGATAYYCTGIDGGNKELVMSTFSDGIPANQGALLEGSGKVTFTPTASALVAPGTNLLKPGTGATVPQTQTEDDDNYTNFILTTNNGASATPKFFKVNSKGNTVAVGKAYLQILSTNVGAREYFWFEDETTGIEAAKASQKMNGEFFNLAGQRVAQPAKGLYIVNGKKVIMK